MEGYRRVSILRICCGLSWTPKYSKANVCEQQKNVFSVSVLCFVVNVKLLDGMNSCRIIESDGCQCPLVTTNTISRDEVQTGVSIHVGV